VTRAARRDRDTPAGYSRLQIILHWTIAGLVIFQLLLNGGIEDAFDDRMDGDTVDDLGWAVLHIAVGLAVLGLAVVRVIVRLYRGAPPAHDDNPAFINLLGLLTHLALYGLIFLMPLTGAVAWFGHNDLAAELHEFGRLALIVLILLHVAGAFVEHFVFRNDTIQRMLRPGRQ
jgi:cytochrome b561